MKNTHKNNAVLLDAINAGYGKYMKLHDVPMDAVDGAASDC